MRDFESFTVVMLKMKQLHSSAYRYSKFPYRPISTECEFLVRVGRGRSTSYNSLCPTCQATRLGFDIISVYIDSVSQPMFRETKRFFKYI